MPNENHKPDQPLDFGCNNLLGPLYPGRDHMAQGQHYVRHVDAMTREGLHSKSRIAGELAARDVEIERAWAARDAAVANLEACVEAEVRRAVAAERERSEMLRQALLKCKTCALPTEVRDLVTSVLRA